MADRRATGILRQLGDAAHWSLPDAALLAWFTAERDEGAFAELVRRHGPMVLGVCQRITRQRQDAEDAFQATFLILARKASRIARPELLANWLYGVAYRVARKARRTAARRRTREGQVAVMPDTSVLPAEPTSDLAAFLDEELAALPERFRAAVLLCDLYELSHAAAAERLGIPKGTLSNRLSAGRKKLAARLARRGITLPAVGLGVALGGVTPTLAARTVSLALGGVASAAVQQLTLTGGASMKAIGWTAAACAAIGLAAGVVSALPVEEPAKPAANPPAAAKAEEPRPDKEPAAKPGRPRMIHRVELRDTTAGEPTWSPDGKLLALRTAEQFITVYDATTLKPRGLVRANKPHAIGFFRDQPVLVTYRREAGQINGESKLEFWKVPAMGNEIVLNPPTDVTALDPDDGEPFALLPGDRFVLCVAYRATLDHSGKGVRYNATFRIVDVSTGRSVREVLQFQHSGSLTHCVSSDGKNLYLGSFENGVGRLGCRAISTGKQVWEREISKFTDAEWEQVQEPFRHVRISVIASPGGKLIAASVPRKPFQTVPIPGLPSELCLFDAATGAPGIRLEGQPAEFINGVSFSSDSRMMSGKMSEGRLGPKLVIWDTKSGKILKSWLGNASAQFSPTRPVVAILEYVVDSEGNRQFTTSILGLWDVAPLLKAAPSK